MKTNRIALALALAGLAGPALAEKCHICDFSDEPIVVKPTKSSGGAPSVDEMVVTKLNDASTPLLSERDRPLQRGAVPNSGALTRYELMTMWPSKGGTERPRASSPVAPSAQGAGTYSKTLTFTLSTTNPLEPGARLATPKGSQPATQLTNGGAIQQHGLSGTAARR
jgi:hypothetical protein